jgi:hypothetical protein
MLKARNAFAAAIVALFAMESGLGHSQQSQQQPYGPTKSEKNAESHQERSDDPALHVQSSPSDHLQKATCDDGHESPDERSEFWVIFGHRIKITDFWLLFSLGFSCLSGLAKLIGFGEPSLTGTNSTPWSTELSFCLTVLMSN